MQEEYEFRIDEELAHLLLKPGEGTTLGSVRLVRLPARSFVVAEIGRLQEQCRSLYGQPFFYGWRILRSYPAAELADARIFSLVCESFLRTGE